MKTDTQNNRTSFFLENKKSLTVLFILFLLSSVGMFGQNKPAVVLEQVTTIEVDTLNSSKAVALDSDVDFMSWFMGSKHNQNFQESTSSTAASITARKKQIISSGVTPNKVLYRTFVKRIVNQDNVIV